MFLKKGDLVDIISPASSITKHEFENIEKFLHSQGLCTRFHMAKELLLEKKPSSHIPAFSAKKRFEQLRFALENKESKAVWCVRGGYGSADIIPFLQTLPKIAQTKMFIGFSDITSLAIFLNQQWNFEIIYAPMLNQLAKNQLSSASKRKILQFIFGKKPQLNYNISAQNNCKNAKNITAEIVGGCLSVAASHFATKNQIDWQNKILFLEDIDESGERLDRYFCQIVEVIKSTKSYPKAILLGNFYFQITSRNKKKNIALANAKLIKRLHEASIDIPIFVENSHCLGHAKNMMPLIIGRAAQIKDGKLKQ